MDAKTLLQNRRSVRKYTDEVVPKKVLDEVFELTVRAPSWKNCQIARYTIIQDKAIINKIADQGVNDFVYNTKNLKYAHNLCVLSYVKGISGKNNDEYATSKKDWEVFDAGIAAHQFCLSLQANNLGSVILGIIDPEYIAELIDLPKKEAVAALIIFGYPNDEVSYTSRLPIEEIVRYKL